jgi:hypothetical protein
MTYVRLTWISFSTIVLLVVGDGAAVADSLTFSFSEINSQATAGGSTTAASDAPTSGSGSRTVTKGAASATSTWDFTSTSLTLDFDHVTAGSSNSSAYTFAEFLFTVDADTSYSLAGSYSFTDNAAGTASETAGFYMYLYDLTADEYLLFENDHFGAALDDGTFVFGDPASFPEGSLTGSLVAGHSYELYVEAIVRNSFSDSSYPVFYGSGSFSLEIGEAQVAAVPEPSTLALCGVGAAVLAWRRRRRT